MSAAAPSAGPPPPATAEAAPGGALVPCECWGRLTQDVRRLVLRDALLVRPSPLAPRADAPPRPPGAPRGAGQPPAAAAGYGLAQAVAAARWLDAMEPLVVAAEPAAAARRIGELRRCLRQLSAEVGSGRTGAELVELFWIKLAGPLPELGALARDGSALPPLLQAYSAFAAALAIHSGAPMSPGAPPRAPGGRRGGCGGEDEAIGALCRDIWQSREDSLRRALRTVEEELADQGDGEGALRACREALALDPTSPLPYLARARAHLGRGLRWRCAEDARLHRWWAARRGPHGGARAAAAALLLAEALAGEAEARAAAAPAGLGSKAACSRLADEAELALHDACRGRRGGLAAAGAAAQDVGDRIEAVRAACRCAEDLEGSPPTVPDASGAGADGAAPSERHYALPWPLDLTAGLPDAALFGRALSVGSSREHGPLELLFLDARGVLDLLATVHGLAGRARAFARRHAEVLHWKYRPKPVHVHLQAPSPQRLAHALVCLAVAGQAGQAGGGEGARGAAAAAPGGGPGAAEVGQDLSSCALLTALVFCRTLTAAQHEEVRRLLSLLVLASTSLAGMRALFPWLELEGGGGRSAELTADAAASAAGGTPAGAAPLASQEWSQTPLLYSLQQVWIGWLAAGAVEAEEGVAAAVDEAAVHRAAQRSLLGAHAAAACAQLDPEQQPDMGAALSQRHLWALTGHLPAGEPPSDAEAEASATAAAGEPLEEDDVGCVAAQPQLRRPDPRARWRPLLRELAACQRGGGWRGRGWRLNPCALDPWDWTYQPDALADPFQVFSWKLGAAAEAAGGAAEASGGPRVCRLARPAEPALPAPGAAEPPAVEVIWDHLLGQLEALGAVLNAPEAAMRADESARAPAPEPAPPRPPRPAAGAAPSRSARPSAVRDSLPDIVRTPPAAPRPRRGGRASAGALGAPPAEPRGPPHREEAGRVQEMTPEEVRDEVEKFRRTRQDRSLDLEVHDYATLASVCKMRADWWGEGASYSDVYKESIDTGEEATWDPAPRACVPLRLQARMGAGPAWRLAVAAASRRLAFDAIDARTLLCSGMGLLAACTELEPLLKSTPHSYVQTRHCEELFLDHLGAVQAAVAAAGDADSTAAVEEGGLLKAAPAPSWTPPRSARELLGPGVPTPPPRERRAVLSYGGVLRRAAAPAQRAAARSARGPRTWRQRCELLRPLPHVLPLVAAAARQEEEPAAPERPPAPPPPPPAPPPRAGAPPELGLAGRLLPEAARRPRQQPSPRCPGELFLPRPEAPAPPLGAESELAARLAQESLSADVGAAEAQYLLGVAIRAEPLGGELSLDCLGASRLPARHDLPFWDSSLEAGGASASSWPCAARHPASLRAALAGGAEDPPLASGAADEGAGSPDALACFGRHCPAPSPREAAIALGPRLLRIRRLGGHPSLCLRPPAGDAWRCCNAAFCGRPAAPGGRVPGGGPEATAAGELICERCGCARYCSKACRATHRVAHAFECGALRGLRRAARAAEARGGQEGRAALGALLQELLLKQSSMRGGLAEEAEGQLFDARASCSHSAAGIVRLMARWLASRQQTPALHAAADGGLVFSMVAGLGHEGDAAEALAPRRMALSVAAVQEWRASAQTFRPPLEVEDQLGPDAALESAPCGAFCAALRPLQVPLAELRPLVPVICIAWGEAAGAALQAMTVQRPAGAAIAASGSSAAQGCGRRPPQALPPALAGHSDSIQLIDNVQLDVVTGKAVFLAHAGALRGPGASQALVLLLDASRGMRAVSALAPASSLRRCSH